MLWGRLLFICSRTGETPISQLIRVIYLAASAKNYNRLFEHKVKNLMRKQVKVKPNSKHQSLEEQPDGSLIIRLKSLPIDGNANEELIALLAEKFDVPKAKIKIKSGLSSRQKMIEISFDN